MVKSDAQRLTPQMIRQETTTDLAATWKCRRIPEWFYVARQAHGCTKWPC